MYPFLVFLLQWRRIKSNSNSIQRTTDRRRMQGHFNSEYVLIYCHGQLCFHNYSWYKLPLGSKGNYISLYNGPLTIWLFIIPSSQKEIMKKNFSVWWDEMTIILHQQLRCAFYLNNHESGVEEKERLAMMWQPAAANSRAVGFLLFNHSKLSPRGHVPHQNDVLKLDVESNTKRHCV